jgi:hypothetical protein
MPRNIDGGLGKFSEELSMRIAINIHAPHRAIGIALVSVVEPESGEALALGQEPLKPLFWAASHL